MPSDSENAPSPASKAFADRLAKYAYAAASSPPSPRMSPLRRSTRSQTSNSAAARSPLPSTPQERIYDRGSPLKKVASSSSSSVSLSATKKRSAKSISKEDEEFQDIDTEEETDDENYKGEKSNSGSLKGGRKSTMKKVVKKPRGYAAPEMYEHLRPLNDLLVKGQDLVFCGINPGKMSSTLGHHFAHPTNKFWKALYQSGLTSRLMSPTEDYKVVDEYNYGLTNLVGRPTSEQSELSTLEMKLNTINLLQKFIKYQPNVVCFVGKKIWDVFESVVGKTAEFDEDTKQKVKLEGEVKNEEGKGDGEKGRSVVLLAPTPERGKVKIEPVELGDQPPLLPLSASPSRTPHLTPVQTASPSPIKAKAIKGGTKPPKTPFSFSQPRALRIVHLPEEDGGAVKCTYFFVVPSTSGLERTPFPEQVSNFAALKALVDELKEGKSLKGDFLNISVKGVEGTVEDMRRAAILKGAL
ncbi:TDG/mug DNA glycosylase [Cryptococcus neoformans]|nr:TDG/mug DNA glycosylase [Cryptococcus neoformans var. grubii]